MTLDEAIIHADEKAEGDCPCARDHQELASFLRRLKVLEKAHLDMSGVNKLVGSILDIIKKRFPAFDEDDDDLWDELTGFIDIELNVDDYPNHN